MVPGAGVEPAQPYSRGILSPLRLPVSPPGRGAGVKARAHGATTRIKDREKWRLGSESNRRTRLCRPLHNHSATQPECLLMVFPGVSCWTHREDKKNGAGNETRTRDPNLGKVVLYQLSYSRYTAILTYIGTKFLSSCKPSCSRMASPRGVEPLLLG